MTPHPRLSRPALAVLACLAALVWLAVGVYGAVQAPWFGLSEFGALELAAWSAVGLATGGAVLGQNGDRPPAVAAALVASAALVGAAPWQVAVVAAMGTVPSLWRRHEHPLLRVLAAGAFGAGLPGVLRLAVDLGGPTLGQGSLPLVLVAVLVGVFAIVLPVAESVGGRLVLPAAEHVDAAHLVRRRFESNIVLLSLALVAALTYRALGLVSIALLLFPAFMARTGMRRHEEGRRAVVQTLAAMTQLPEWVGVVDRHHTDRVVAMVEAAAVELGLESRLRRDLVRAAQLHELGHLDGGVVRGDRGRIARSGAAVIEQARVPARVAQIVQATDPERDLLSVSDEVAFCAGLVAHACAWDRAGTTPTEEERIASLLAAAQRREHPVEATT